jgi:hypothetical protein
VPPRDLSEARGAPRGASPAATDACRRGGGCASRVDQPKGSVGGMRPGYKPSDERRCRGKAGSCIQRHDLDGFIASESPVRSSAASSPALSSTPTRSSTSRPGSQRRRLDHPARDLPAHRRSTRRRIHDLSRHSEIRNVGAPRDAGLLICQPPSRVKRLVMVTGRWRRLVPRLPGIIARTASRVRECRRHKRRRKREHCEDKRPQALPLRHTPSFRTISRLVEISALPRFCGRRSGGGAPLRPAAGAGRA